MVTRCTSWAYVAAVLLLTGVSTATAKYSGGTGEPNDPYQIATAADLIALGETPADYGKHFILTADIDLDPNLPGRKVFDRAVIAPDTNPNAEWVFDGTAFTGVFDGNRHSISHLVVAGVSYLGLFGQLRSGAEVRDLGVVDVHIVGSGWGVVGGLAGANGQTEAGWIRPGNLTNCYSTGAVSGGSVVGGLVGDNAGPVTRCHSSAAVSGDWYVGGLVGINCDGIITASYSTGVVSGNSYVGGLVGLHHAEDMAVLTDCFSTGMVSGDKYVGGLIGGNGLMPRDSVSTGPGDVIQCYSTGAVSGSSHVGGLVGYRYFTWKRPVTESFWDAETSGQTASADGTGKTTAEMQTASTFLEAGWDFVGETANGTADIWKIAEGMGYPRLAWEKYSGGSGTANDPYQIATAADLIALGETPDDYGKHFILTADIDLDPNLPGCKVFDKAVIAPDIDPNNEWYSFDGTAFTGTFEGNAHTVSHVTIMGKDYLGLFGLLKSGAAVKNLGVVDVNIAGSGECVGGLVGSNGSWEAGGGTVANCYSTGAVTGGSGVGGLVGWNVGTIRDSYAAGSVAGHSRVGGLAGRNGFMGLYGYGYPGTVSNCYSVCAVRVPADREGGGLLGGNECGEVMFCFWDIQTSGQTTSNGGTGKTTAEMHMGSSFLAWGCTPAVWTIDEGVDYPRLAWEGKPGKALPALADFLAGSGGQADPYLICTADDLNTIGLFPCDWDKHFKLMANIDLSAFDGKDGRPAFNVIGDCHWEWHYSGEPALYGPCFSGVFDGNGHTISGLTVESQSRCVGLFRGLSGPGQIQNVGVVDVNVVVDVEIRFPEHGIGPMDGPVVGALVAFNSGGTVIGCYCTGTISGGLWVGGLVGYNDGAITRCFSNGSVRSGGQYGSVGGLVGTNNYGTVTQCYSTGTVNGDSPAGGLVGSGYPGDVTACFWDIQTSGQATSAGGTGKTTAEMQTAETFLDAGWDFVGETANGTEDIWWILEGQDYPRLWWEDASE